MLARLKKIAKRLKQEIQALYLVAKDGQTQLTAKIVITVVIAYAVSPIDLIPDFIPIIGLLDDLVLLPLGITLAIRLIPTDLMQHCRGKVASMQQRNRNSLPHRTGISPIAVGVSIVTLWVILVALVAKFAI